MKPWGKGLTSCKISHEQDGFTQHCRVREDLGWTELDRGLCFRAGGKVLPPNSLLPRTQRRQLTELEALICTPMLPTLPLSVSLEQTELNSEHMLLSFFLCWWKGLYSQWPEILSPHQKRQLREALTKACGSNVNTVSSRKLGGALCKCTGKEFNGLLFWMKDSVGSGGETLSFKATDIDFPTHSATIFQVNAHLLHSPSRWVKTFPLVKCPPGARHWVKLNTFIPLFYLPVTLWRSHQYIIIVPISWISTLRFREVKWFDLP